MVLLPETRINYMQIYLRLFINARQDKTCQLQTGAMSVLQQEVREHCYNNNQGVTNYTLPTNTTSHLDPIPVDQKSKGIYAKPSMKTVALREMSCS